MGNDTHLFIAIGDLVCHMTQIIQEDFIEKGNLSYYRRGEGRVEAGFVYWSPYEFEWFDIFAYVFFNPADD